MIFLFLIARSIQLKYLDGDEPWKKKLPEFIKRFSYSLLDIIFSIKLFIILSETREPEFTIEVIFKPNGVFFFYFFPKKITGW